jgi:hypothetical protein
MWHQDSVGLRWLAGFSMVAIFYGISNRDVLEPVLTTSNPIFWAFVFLLLNILSSGVSLFLLQILRTSEYNYLSIASMKIWKTATETFNSGIPSAKETITFKRPKNWGRLNKLAWRFYLAAGLSFYIALLLAVIGLLKE